MALLRSLGFKSTPDRQFSQAIKNIFGYYPINLNLYRLAFRHRSAAEGPQGLKINNERLEYLGDAVLGSIIADYLFKKFPRKDEGFLTEMRSKIVCRSRLNKLATKLGLDKLIQTNFDSKTISRSVRGDAFEAFIGALYLDKGYNFTRQVIIQHIINVHLDIDELVHEESNYKSKLIEWTQKEKKSISFNVIDEVGEGFSKQYIVKVILDGETMATGRDFSIKNAEQNASEKTWNMIFPSENNATVYPS
ncbi:MAG: ribonuclease III [Bacteroidota bacterium]|nr:ribonuclease III [Bacteroidota bacterium]